jgi:hypothetical protein
VRGQCVRNSLLCFINLKLCQLILKRESIKIITVFIGRVNLNHQNIVIIIR